MSQPQSVTDARGYGDDVLQSSAQLHSRYIVVCINSKRGIAEFALHGLCQSRIFRRNCDRGRITACDFLGERWSAERSEERRVGKSAERGARRSIHVTMQPAI